MINNSNKIKLEQNSELTLIEYNIDEKNKFLKNTFENIEIENGSILKILHFKKQKAMDIFIKVYLDHKNITQVIKILF